MCVLLSREDDYKLFPIAVGGIPAPIMVGVGDLPCVVQRIDVQSWGV